MVLGLRPSLWKPPGEGPGGGPPLSSPDAQLNPSVHRAESRGGQPSTLLRGAVRPSWHGPGLPPRDLAPALPASCTRESFS